MPTHTKSNHVTRGGQITFHSIHMFFQVHNKLAKIIAIGVVVLSVLVAWLLAPDNAWQAVFYTLRNHLYDAFQMSHDAKVTTFWNGQRYVSTLGQQLHNAELGQIYDAVIYRFQVSFLIAFLLGTATFIGSTMYFKDHTKDTWTSKWNFHVFVLCKSIESYGRRESKNKIPSGGIQ